MMLVVHGVWWLLYGRIEFATAPRLQRGLTPKGFTLLIPLTLFALTQKSKQKKSRLWSLSGVEVRPSHSKNLRAKSWNRQNSLRRKTSKLKQRRFLTAFHPCFSAHRSRSVLPILCLLQTGKAWGVRGEMCLSARWRGAYAIRPYSCSPLRQNIRIP